MYSSDLPQSNCFTYMFSRIDINSISEKGSPCLTSLLIGKVGPMDSSLILPVMLLLRTVFIYTSSTSALLGFPTLVYLSVLRSQKFFGIFKHFKSVIPHLGKKNIYLENV